MAPLAQLHGPVRSVLGLTTGLLALIMGVARRTAVGSSPHPERVHDPTEGDPDIGFVGQNGVMISSAEHFVLDGVHVLRSLEFDVSAYDEDFGRTLEIFVQNAEHYFKFLLARVRDMEESEHERESLVILGDRILALYQERETDISTALRMRLVTSVLKKLLPESDPTWLRQTTPKTSSEPLNV
jgi:hypothetical protein